MMKKTLSVLLAIAMVAVSICMPLSVAASAWEVRTNETDLRVGFLNDTHITKSGSGETQTIKALQVLKDIGMEKLAFVGDNVYYNSINDDPLTDVGGYTKLKSAVSSTGWEWNDILVYAMGNHEFPQSNTDDTVSTNSISVFEQQTGLSRNQHVEYNDFHFIAAAPKAYSNVFAEEAEQYMMEEIDKALCEDSTNGVIAVDNNDTPDDTSDDITTITYEGGIPNSKKPVFLLLHQPIGSTLNNGANSYFSESFVSFLANRPQIVNITAHMHRLAQHPQTIGQNAGFTAFQSPMTAGAFHSQWGYTKESEITDTMCSQGSFMEVKDNVVYLYRVDYLNDCYIGEPFVVDIPSIVDDKLDSNTTNDWAHMPYTNTVRYALPSAAAFPEDAKVTANVQGTAVSVTFPNTAVMTSYDEVQQDNFIRGYKIEAVSNGVVAASNEFQADFWKASANRAASYTKSLGGLYYNTEYIINVYPRTPFGVYGEPISTTIKTEEKAVQENAIRYEIENYCPVSKLNKATDFASGGGLCISAQAGMVSDVKSLSRSDANSANPYTIEIPVQLPVDGYYGIELAMGYGGINGYVSVVKMLLDDTELATSTSKGDEDLSLNNTYPWSYIPMMHYTANDRYLTAGSHTIKVEVYLPTANNTQPYLFCADYVEFIPRTQFIDLEATTNIEIEDYISDVTIAQTNGSEGKPSVNSSVRCSGGEYAYFDTTNGVCAVDYVDINIPIYVEDEGYYDMTYLTAPTKPDVMIYLDDATTTALNATYTRVKDELKDSDGKYTYFNSSWAYAQIDTVKLVYMSAGEHTVIIRLGKRAENDIAQYLDYIRFTPATDLLTENGFLHYEAEDYQTNFTSKQPNVGSYPLAGDGRLVYTASGTETVTISFAFNVKEAGKYILEYVGTDGSWRSPLTITVGDSVLTKKEISGTLYKYPDYGENKKYRAEMELEKGLNVLTFSYAPRKNNTQAYTLDYIHIAKPADKVVTNNDATRIEFEDYANVDDDVKSLSAASNGKYVYNSENNDTECVIKAEVEIRDSGYYNIEYLVGNRSLYESPTELASVDIYLDEKLLGSNDNTHYENIASDEGYSWNSAPMCRYFKDAVWLDSGVYTLDAKVTFSEEDTSEACNYQMDYIEFRPSDKIERHGTEYITAHINSKEAMTGIAILAFYNGNQLLSAITKDVTDVRYVNITGTIGTAATIKAFVIDGYTNVTPLVVHQKYTVGE